MRRLCVAGNWKMNTLLQAGVELAAAVAEGARPHVASVDVIVCPPYPYLSAVASKVRGSGVTVGAQNVSASAPGAFTGEVAVNMLLDVGCSAVIVGHSERRALLRETDDEISKKAQAAIAAGLKVILCVGEVLADRQSGKTESVLDTQMTGSLAGIDAAALEHVIIAYEPVWAIGTGVTATNEQAQETHAYLRKWLSNRYNPEIAARTRLLYGGSVKASNAAGLMALPDVDGTLVGGASLKAADFLPIVEAAAAARK